MSSFESSSSAPRPPFHPRAAASQAPAPPALRYSSSDDDSSSDDSSEDEAAPAPAPAPAAMPADDDDAALIDAGLDEAGLEMDVEPAAHLVLAPPEVLSSIKVETGDPTDERLLVASTRYATKDGLDWRLRRDVFDGREMPFYANGDTFVWSVFGTFRVVSPATPPHANIMKPGTAIPSRLVTAESVRFPGEYQTFFGCSDTSPLLIYLDLARAYSLYSEHERIEKFRQGRERIQAGFENQLLSWGPPKTTACVLPFSLFRHMSRKRDEREREEMQKKINPRGGASKGKRKSPAASSGAPSPAAASSDEPPPKKPRTGGASSKPKGPPPPATDLMSRQWAIYLHGRLVPAARVWAEAKHAAGEIKTPRDYIESKFIKSAMSLDKWARDKDSLPPSKQVNGPSKAKTAAIAERAGEELGKRVKSYDSDYRKVAEHWMMEVYVTTNPDAWSALQQVLTGLDEEWTETLRSKRIEAMGNDSGMDF